MTKTIRIDSEVFDVLMKAAKPLVDSPNSVLRRLLKIDKTKKVKKAVDSVSSKE